MFEHQGSVYPQHPLPQMPHHQPQHHQEIMTDDRDTISQSEYGDWSREDIYQSISRGSHTNPSSRRLEADTCWCSITNKLCQGAQPVRFNFIVIFIFKYILYTFYIFKCLHLF